MLSPNQLESAGNRVAAIYNDIEAKMLDHLVASMVNDEQFGQRSMTELALVSQTHTDELRTILDNERANISDAVYETVEEYLRASDNDDVKRLGEGEPVWPQQVQATVAGVALILERDNLQMVEGAKQAFLDSSIKAITRVNTGTMTTERALHSAVRELEGEGIPIITYQNSKTGMVTVRNKVDVAVRRHIRTQIAQDGMRMSMDRLEKLNVQLVEVSSHEDSRPSHREWQGRCYSLLGDIEIEGTKYPDFYSATHYGSVDGLGGANCRHSFGPYRHGAPRAYEPNPKHPSGLPGEEVYELEQQQRYLEREIRKAKRELRGAQQIYDKDPKNVASKSALIKAQDKLKRRQEGMRNLINEANAKCKPGTKVLYRKPNREWAGDMPKSEKVSASGRSLKAFMDQKSVKDSLKKNGITQKEFRAGITSEMAKLGGTSKDFGSLSAKDQRRIFDKIKNSIDTKLPSTKKALAGKHVDKLAGVPRGNPMSFDKANGGRVNPKFKTDTSFTSNCQTCVVAFESRLRGYNVTAKPRDFSEHAPTQILALDSRKAWIDPNTGRHPEFIIESSAKTPTKMKAFLNDTVQQGERYTIEFNWKDGGTMGHIISLDRNEQGILRLYDPQSGEIFLDVDEVIKKYTPEEIEMRKKRFGARSKRGKQTQETQNAMDDYLGQIRYTSTISGMKFYDGPKLVRIDNMEFNRDIVGKVLEGA